MKRAWLITILICLLLLCGGGAVLLLPQVVPFDQCSDVYKRYADMDGVDATFIKDYKVNDSIRVNVTLLQATDSVSWNIIAKDLNVPPPPEIPDEYKGLFLQSNSFGYFIVKNKPNEDKQMHNKRKDICTFSREKMTICIFHTCDETQIDAILDNSIDEITF
ncbi:MAG: hypothetical protein II849_05735 [Bacteroidales bacterium]|nr:hypothetical protein [Bacteroidales bacterium]